MGALTEQEIRSCMITNLRLAAEHCEQLAILPMRGPTYKLMREELLLIEGCCRQMCAWRGDTRWLPLGLAMEQVHQRSRFWLTSHHPRRLFLKLAENLRALLRGAEMLDTRATGRAGDILPKPGPAPHRQNKPVQSLVAGSGLVKRPSGLIVPAEHAA